MSACDPRRYSRIDRATFERLLAKLAKQYPEIDPKTVPDKGQASGGGYTISWDYEEASASLAVQCLDSPWYAPCAAIGAGIDEVIGNARTPQP